MVCVSGGVDSVALLHILADLREEWKLVLHVLHFNHGKRAESAEEESFVRGLSAQLGVDVHVRHPERPFEAANFQAKARAWRREEAQKLVGEVGAQVILQGHHEGDQTETVLLKVLRGCHLSRISGMGYREGNFGRPLLDVSKDRLREFLTSKSAAWREDASNVDSVFLRNRIRAELVPLLRELTHGPLEARLQSITTQSKHLRSWLDEHPSARIGKFSASGSGYSGGNAEDDDGDDAELDRRVSSTWHDDVQVSKNWDASAQQYLDENGELDMNVWRQLPGMVQEDQLYEYILGSTGLCLPYQNLRKLWKHMQTDNLSWDWRLGKEWNLVRAGERVWTQHKRAHCRSSFAAASASDGGDADAECLNVEHGVVVSYPRDWTVRAYWEHEEDGEAVVADEGLRLANLPEGSVLCLRMRQPRDRFCPPGRRDGKAVRLKDWMRNSGFPLHARDRTPVVCLNGEVVAVFPAFLGSKVSAEPEDANDDGDGTYDRGGRRMILRVVIDHAPSC